MITHMMKERTNGEEVAKCGVRRKVKRSEAPMTIWHTMVTCPDCLAVMSSGVDSDGTVTV